MKTLSELDEFLKKAIRDPYEVYLDCRRTGGNHVNFEVYRKQDPMLVAVFDLSADMVEDEFFDLNAYIDNEFRKHPDYKPENHD
jgi:hypothetical protein